MSPGPEGSIVLAFSFQQEKCDLTEIDHQLDIGDFEVKMFYLSGRQSVRTGFFKTENNYTYKNSIKD